MNRAKRVLYDLQTVEYLWHRELLRLLSYPLFAIQHGRSERVDEFRWIPGEYTIRTENGSVLKLMDDRWRSPRPLLRRWPATGSEESGFDHPKPARMMISAEIRVGDRARFTDAGGSYTHGSGTYTTSTVQVIELKRTHCNRCGRPLLRGWCPRRHGGEPLGSASI